MHYRDFLLRRLWQIAPTILGLLVLIFFVSRVMPGDPVRLALGPEATREQIEVYQKKLGVDRPLPAQFGHYLAGLVRGDFGESIRTYRDVRLDLLEFLPATVELVLAALLLAVGFGVPLGLLSAVYRNTWVDSILQPATATDAPVVGVAITSQVAVPGSGTGASHEVDIELAARFAVEVAKGLGAGRVRFYDPNEFERLVRLYGELRHLQTLGRGAR